MCAWSALLSEHWSVEARLIMASNMERWNWMTIVKAQFSMAGGFSNQNNIVLQFEDKLICLCLTDLRLGASSEGISHTVTNGFSVIMTHHRCRMGSGVCLIATKAPPWSRYSTAYSSSKICSYIKRERTHSAVACHLCSWPTHVFTHPHSIIQISKVIIRCTHTNTQITHHSNPNDYFSLPFLIRNKPHKLTNARIKRGKSQPPALYAGTLKISFD